MNRELKTTGLTEREQELITRIANRAVQESLSYLNQAVPADVEADLVLVHLNGCPLDLECMAAGRTFDIIHDVTGIRSYLNRATGELSGYFLPRFARPKSSKPKAEPKALDELPDTVVLYYVEELAWAEAGGTEPRLRTFLVRETPKLFLIEDPEHFHDYSKRKLKDEIFRQGYGHNKEAAMARALSRVQRRLEEAERKYQAAQKNLQQLKDLQDKWDMEPDEL